MTVMTFDYSGQGASTGTIGFDNAKTDCIPLEIHDAAVELHNRTGISYERIILVGHSMGGRSILRLLQDFNNEAAITDTTPLDIKNVILISSEVNYHKNTQASLFAGTSDAEEEPWISYNADYIRGTDVYLFGSTADDIVKASDIVEIYNHLGGTANYSGGRYEYSEYNANMDRISVGITSGVLHSYQMYSPEFVSFVNDAIYDITGIETIYEPGRFYFIYTGWVTALAGVFLLMLGLNLGEQTVIEGEEIPRLISEKQFLLRKLLMWLPGILMALLVCTVAVMMPFGSPVMNIPYMCFIAGYGLVMLISYRKGCFKGTVGRLPGASLRINSDKTAVFVSIFVALLVCFFTWFILRESMYRLMPFNIRVFWLLFATALMSIGYYISGVETDMLKEYGTGKGRIIYSLIQYVPLFLFVLFYLVIKSYSGLIGQILNVFLMYILCIPIGDYLRSRLKNRLVGAVVTAFLFQLLMITSAAIISMF